MHHSSYKIIIILDMQQIIDIGANLTDKQFRNDLYEILEKAYQQNITIIITGSTIKSSYDAFEIVRKNQKYNLFSTVGIHPHNAKMWNEKTKSSIIDLSKNKEIVAIGECGLDYNRMFSTKEQQLYCFEQHIQIAIDAELPLFCHERDAFDDFIKIIDKYKNKLIEKNIKIVIHCFTGNLYEASEYIKRGCYIGLTGFICDDRRNINITNIIRKHIIPLDKLMTETDAPYMTPSFSIPRRNEPSNIKYVIGKLAELFSLSENEIISQTTRNAISVFNL